MSTLKCKHCGGELKRIHGRTYQCLYCDVIQTIDSNISSDLADPKEQLYENALELFFEAKTEADYLLAADHFARIMDFHDSASLYEECVTQAKACHHTETYDKACFLMEDGGVDSLQSACDLFEEIAGYKDSDKKRDECLAQLRIARQRQAAYRQAEKRKKRLRRIILWSVLLTLAAGIAGRIVWGFIAHSVQGIKIEITDMAPKYDDRYAYVYFDYTIQNHSLATLDYVAVTATFSDQNGKVIGTMQSDFGSLYGSGKLDLAFGKSVIKEIYLQENLSNSFTAPDQKLFVTLFKNGIKDLQIQYQITSAKWSDGHSYYDHWY